MPLSFAALLGGVVTVIGTSTNIVVSGLMGETGLEPMGFFELGAVGVPIAIVGTILIVALAPIVLPARRPARTGLDEEARQFVTEMLVNAGGPLDGKAVEEAGLRHLSLGLSRRHRTTGIPDRPRRTRRGPAGQRPAALRRPHRAGRRTGRDPGLDRRGDRPHA
jgi:di/tricarboxylate transporter